MSDITFPGILFKHEMGKMCRPKQAKSSELLIQKTHFGGNARGLRKRERVSRRAIFLEREMKTTKEWQKVRKWKVGARLAHYGTEVKVKTDSVSRKHKESGKAKGI